MLVVTPKNDNVFTNSDQSWLSVSGCHRFESSLLRRIDISCHLPTLDYYVDFQKKIQVSTTVGMTGTLRQYVVSDNKAPGGRTVCMMTPCFVIDQTSRDIVV